MRDGDAGWWHHAGSRDAGCGIAVRGCGMLSKISIGTTATDPSANEPSAFLAALAKLAEF